MYLIIVNYFIFLEKIFFQRELAYYLNAIKNETQLWFL